jgi:lactoylglutathione lyase
MRWFVATIAGAVLFFSASPSTLAAETSSPRLQLTALNTTDLERSVRFYTDVLGMKEARRFRSAKMTEVVMSYSGGMEEPFVTLVYNPDHQGSYVTGDAFSRIGLRLPNLAAVIAKCRQFPGCVVTREPTAAIQGAEIGMIKDPDGFAYELIEAH